MLQLRPYQHLAVDSVYPLDAKSRKLVVIPTGGGKSLISAKLSDNETALGGRVLVLTHVQELVSQTAKELARLDPDLDVGIFCAALKRKETDNAVTVASVQSVYKCLEYWFDVDLIIIDEAHRITPVGGKLYRAVLRQFPHVPIIGLTATPFRDGTGYLHEGEYKLFDEISFEISYDELINLGYLVPFAQKGSDLAYDPANVRKNRGEYNQKDLDKLVDVPKTRRIIEQFVKRSQGRHYPLVFAINVRHAKIIRQIFAEDHNLHCAIVYGDMSRDELERSTEISDFENGLADVLVNVGILTTGYDFRPIDCIGLFCPIASPVKYIQCCGRGTRISPETSKRDCLLLDYGGNVTRHGNFWEPEIKTKGKDKGPVKYCGDCGEKTSISTRRCACCNTKFPEMFKRCPDCDEEFDISAQTCDVCGYEWPIKEDKLDESGTQILPNRLTWLTVEGANYRPHRKGGSTHTCFVSEYKTVEGGMVPEYVFPEFRAARRNFELWWRFHTPDSRRPAPKTAGEAYGRRAELAIPRKICVIRSGKFFVIKQKDFNRGRENQDSSEAGKQSAAAV